MANKQELEKNLIERVAKKIGKDNQTLEEVIEKMMKSVDNWAQEHKKELGELDEKTRQEFRKPSFLLSKLIKIKYAEEKLTQIIYHNLKRAPGNLSDKQRMLAMYDTFAKFDYKCAYSDTLLLGGKEEIHLEHIIPVTMGGPTDDWNCIPICGTCNSSKSDKHLLDWWKDNRQVEEEYKLVKIFEYMTSKLLDETNTIKYAKQENNPMHLDAITFLNQLLNHIEENKQYIFDKKFDSEKEKQNAINFKLKELKSTFEKVVKKNDRNTKTDKQYFAEQKEMVKYVKSLGVSSYYKIAYTYFNTIKEMQNQGKTEEEIQTFCFNQYNGFNFMLFVEKAIEFRNKEIYDKKGNLKKVKGSFYGITSDAELGGMAAYVRGVYRGTVRGRMLEHFKHILDKIGFPWSAKDEIKNYFNNRWVEKYNKFKDFLTKNDYYPRQSKSSTDDEKELFVWVANQRKRLDPRNINDERVKLLNAINFVWISENNWFEDFLIGLDDYKAKHGNYVGITHDPIIGHHVSIVRQAKKGKGSTRLESYMIEELKLRLFPWDAHEDMWLFQYENLKKFLKENERMPLSTKFQDPTEEQKYEKALADWCLKQRKDFNNNKLKDNHKILLDQLGFIFDKRDWFKEFYTKLIQYRDKEIFNNKGLLKKERGSFDYLVMDKEIGLTVKNIRQAYKGKGNLKLESDMIKKLDAIGFPWEARAKKIQEDDLSL